MVCLLPAARRIKFCICSSTCRLTLHMYSAVVADVPGSRTARLVPSALSAVLGKEVQHCCSTVIVVCLLIRA